MPAGAFANFHVYGPAQSAGVVVGAGAAIPAASATARMGEVATGAGSVPFAKPTRLRNSPMVTSGVGAIVQALPKGRARPALLVRIGELSQDDVTGAVWEAEVVPGTTYREAIQQLLAGGGGGGGGGLTVEQDQRLRMIEKLNRNKFITDPATGVATLYDDDGATVLMTADLFEDAAGAQPYRGKGAERRERFA